MEKKLVALLLVGLCGWTNSPKVMVTPNPASKDLLMIPTISVSLDEVLEAYEVETVWATDEFVRQALGLEELTIEWEMLVEDNILLIITHPGAEDEETFSFPVVTPEEGGHAGNLRVLLPPVCRCPQSGGSCTSEQCEDSKTCTGSDGATGACGYYAPTFEME